MRNAGAALADCPDLVVTQMDAVGEHGPVGQQTGGLVHVGVAVRPGLQFAHPRNLTSDILISDAMLCIA